MTELKIYKSSGKETIKKIVPIYQKHFGRSNVGADDIFFIAEDERKIIGVVRFCVENTTPLLRSMFVDPQCRKRGIGKSLLKEFEKHLKENKIERVFCLPWGYLENFYSEIGFNRCKSDKVPLFLNERLLEYQSRNDDEIIFMVRK